MKRLGTVLMIAAAILSIGANAHGAHVCVAVGWYGEFSHIHSENGQIPPTRDDLPEQMQGLATASDGTIYAGTGDGNIYTLDPLTGGTTFLLNEPTLGFQSIRGMAFSATDELYVTTTDSHHVGSLYTMDLGSGTASFVANLAGDVNSAQGLEFAPDGSLYGIRPHQYTPGTYDLFTIDPVNGNTQLIYEHAATDAGVNQSLAFMPDAIGGGTFAQLDPITGHVIGDTIALTGDFRGLAQVPEPGTVALLLAAVAATIVRTTRRRRR